MVIVANCGEFSSRCFTDDAEGGGEGPSGGPPKTPADGEEKAEGT